MTEERARLVQALGIVIDDLEHRGYARTGVIRRARAELATGESEHAPDSCRLCGREIVQRARGRRREFCSDQHRATFWKRNAKMSA